MSAPTTIATLSATDSPYSATKVGKLIPANHSKADSLNLTPPTPPIDFQSAGYGGSKRKRHLFFPSLIRAATRLIRFLRTGCAINNGFYANAKFCCKIRRNQTLLVGNTGACPPASGCPALPNEFHRKDATSQLVQAERNVPGKENISTSSYKARLILVCMAFFSMLSMQSIAYAGDNIELCWVECSDNGDSSNGTDIYTTGKSQIPILTAQLKEIDVPHTGQGDAIYRAYEMWSAFRVGKTNQDAADWAATDWTSASEDIHLQIPDNGTEYEMCDGVERHAFKVALPTFGGEGDTRSYGDWYVQANNLQRDNSVTLNGIWFCPNNETINNIPVGTTVVVRLEFELRRSLKFWGVHYWSTWSTEYLYLGIHRIRADVPRITWEASSDWQQVINVDGYSDYGDVKGVAHNAQKPDRVSIVPGVSEQHFTADGVGGQRIGGTAGVVEDAVAYADYPGNDPSLGANLTYGRWYFSESYSRYLFRPNSAAINSLKPGERVISYLHYGWEDSDCNYCEHGLLVKHTSTRVQIDAPRLVLAIDSTGPPINEGEAATFTLTANTNPVNSIRISYNGENISGNFIENSPGNPGGSHITEPLEFTREGGTGPYKATLLVPTRAKNAVREDAGEIQVTLTDGTDYTADPMNNVGIAQVFDADVAILSITDAPDTNPGSTAEFQVVSQAEPPGAVRVTYNPVNTVGNFLDTTRLQSEANKSRDSGENREAILNFSRSGNAGPYFAPLTVGTTTSSETSGVITVTLVRDSANPKNYVLSANVDQQSATVNISGSPLPQLSVATTDPATEGADAVFTVTTTQNPSSALRVSYIPSNVKGEFLKLNNGETEGDARHADLTFTQSGTDYSAELRVATKAANGTDEDHGEISVTLVAGSGYGLNPSMGTATAAIHDAEIPSLSISLAQAEWNAGETVDFTITSDQMPWQPLSVSYLLQSTTTANFIDEASNEYVSGVQRSESLTFAQAGGTGPYFATVSIPTVIPADAYEGKFTMSLVDDTEVPRNYKLSANAAEQSAEVTVKVIKPDLAISSSLSVLDIREGATATITVVADADPTRSIAVKYTPTDAVGHDFLDTANGASGTERLTSPLAFELDPNDSLLKASFPVPSRSSNKADEENGTFTVALVLTDDYTLNTADTVATVNVSDTDIPELKIHDAPDISPGNSASFTVETEIRPNGPLMVRFDSEDISGSFLSSNASRMEELTFAPNSSSAYTAIITVETAGTGQSGSNGEIKVTLLDDIAPQKYELPTAADERSASVSITPSPTPQLSIGNAAPVVEGDSVTAMFPLTSQIQPEDFTLNYTPANVTGDFLGARHDSAQTHAFSQSDFALESGLYKAMLPVAVDNDETTEIDGLFRVTLKASSIPVKYRVDTSSSSATAVVTDDDGGLPTVNLEADFLASGPTNAFYHVVSDISVKSDLSLQITATYDGGATATINTSIQAGQMTSEQIRILLVHNNQNLQTVEIDESTRYIKGGSARISVPPPATGTKTLTISWKPGYDGNISAAGGSDASIDSQYMVGEVIVGYDTGEESFYLSETRNGTLENEQTVTAANYGGFNEYLDESKYDGFDVHSDKEEARFAENFKYGSWYQKITSDDVYESLHSADCPGWCATILFVPNSSAINQLSPGDVVHATYSYILGSIDSAKITVTITRLTNTVSIQWAQSVATNSAGNPEITYTGESNFADLEGTIATNFNYEPSDSNRKNGWSYEYHEFTGDEPDEFYTSAAEAKVEAVGGFAGTESKYGDGNSQLIAKYGLWYVAEDNSKFLFRPNGSEISKMASGDVVYAALKIKIGHCPATGYCGSLQGSNLTNEVVATVRITSIEKNEVGPDPVSNLNTNEADAIRYKYSSTIKSILPDLFKAMHTSTTDALRSRVEQTFSGIDTPAYTLNGEDTLTEFIAMQLQSYEKESMEKAKLLRLSSFSAPVLLVEPLANPVTIWGTGDFQFMSMDEDDDPFTWDGKVYGGQTGVDVHFNNNVLLGFAYSWFTGSADYTYDDGQLQYSGTQQALQYGFHPFAAWRSLDENTEIWGSGGFGVGKVSVDIPEIGLEDAGTNFYTFNIGASNIVYSLGEIENVGAPELKLVGDAWTAKNSISANRQYIKGDYAVLQQMRLMAEGTYPSQLEDGTVLKPKLGLGARLDSGDAASGFGLEGVGEIFYEVNPTISASARGNLLLFHNELSNAGGIQAKLLYEPDRKGLGKKARLSSSLGELDNDALQELWENGFSEDQFENAPNALDMRIDAEMGYGMGFWDGSGLSTPYIGQSIINGKEIEFSMGNRFSFGQNMSFELKSSVGEHLDEGRDVGINFGGNVNW